VLRRAVDDLSGVPKQRIVNLLRPVICLSMLSWMRFHEADSSEAAACVPSFDLCIKSYS
jgi:hypothetical protein